MMTFKSAPDRINVLNKSLLSTNIEGDIMKQIIRLTNINIKHS